MIGAPPQYGAVEASMLYVRDDVGRYHQADADKIIGEATQIYNASFKRGEKIENVKAAERWIKLKLMRYTREVFACLFLDSRHHVLAFEELFFGTVDAAIVYPREVVKAALSANAAAVIFAHNHPSGHSEPSPLDCEITATLKQALALIDVRVLDHLVIGETVTSMLDAGLL